MREFPGEYFTIVAARGGEDIWAEIRRRRAVDDDRVPLDIFETATAPASSATAPMQAESALVQSAVPAAGDADDSLSLPDSGHFWPDSTAQAPAPSLGADAHSEAVGQIPVTQVPSAGDAPAESPVEVMLRGRARTDDDLSLPDKDQLWPASVFEPPPATRLTVELPEHLLDSDASELIPESSLSNLEAVPPIQVEVMSSAEIPAAVQAPNLLGHCRCRTPR
jgi:hypothetical protein